MKAPGHGWSEFRLLGYVGYSSGKASPAEVESLLGNVPAFREGKLGSGVKHVPLATGRLALTLDHPGLGPVFVKLYEDDAPDPAREHNEGGPSRPDESFLLNVELFEAGIKVPEPLLFAAEEKSSTERKFVSVNGALIGHEPLHDFLFQVYRREPAPLEKRLAWTREVTSAIIELHKKGYAHGDMQPLNVLVKLEESGGLDLVFIDFDYVKKIVGEAPTSEMTRDLASMGAALQNIVPEDELRALAGYYFDSMGVTPDQRRALCRDLEGTYSDLCGDFRGRFERVNEDLFQKALLQLKNEG